MGNFEFGGYRFCSDQEMKLAKKEAESVEYIRAKVDFRNYEKAKKMYDALIEKQSFITPVGISFLKEMQEKLKAASGQELAAIPAFVPVETAQDKTKSTAKNFEHVMEQRKKDREELYKGKLRNSRIISGFLVLIIIGMFAVVLFGKNSPLQDAETKIMDKYAAWQEELEQREQALNERENSLN